MTTTLSLDFGSMLATLSGSPVKLTRAEWVLLAVLRQAQGRPVPREMINDQMGTAPTSRSPDTHIASLRRKLGGGLIRTVHGVGWAAKSELLACAASASGQEPDYSI
jgi:DNA-binding response OmpR family regulator